MMGEVVLLRGRASPDGRPDQIGRGTDGRKVARVRGVRGRAGL